MTKKPGRTLVSTPRVDRVIILGIDGLDPNILERLIDAGDLPSFASIREIGIYHRLETSNPPQNPVALTLSSIL